MKCREGFVRERLDSDRYNIVSEVVRDALRLLERRQQAEEIKPEALRNAVAGDVARFRWHCKCQCAT